MVGTEKNRLTAHEPPKALPKFTSKSWIPVVQDTLGNTKQSDNGVKKQFGHCRCGHGVLPRPSRHQPSKFGKLVNNYEQSIKPCRLRKFGNKIHTPLLKLTLRNWQRLQQARRLLTRILGTLANLTAAHVGLDLLREPRPPDASLQSFNRLAYPKMC